MGHGRRESHQTERPVVLTAAVQAALHELQHPSDEDLKLGFEMAETLLRTIYVLPKRAERLKRARELRESGEATSKRT